MKQKVSCLVLLGIPAGVVAQNPLKAMPVRVSGPWEVAIGPGSVELQGRQITIGEEAVLQIPQPQTVSLKGELHPKLPVFDEQTGGWRKGARLKQLVTQECTATGLLVPESVVVRPAEGDGEPFALDADYKMDGFWATLGRVEGGAIGPDQPVLIDYDYSPSQLHSIAADGENRLRLALGEPGMGSMLPPELEDGQVAIGNVWVPGRTEALTEENLFPIEPQPPVERPEQSIAERLLPKTLAKLRAGEDVKIVAWGDSVTAGGGVGAQVELRYQNRFAELLRERFPQANITMLTAGWGGQNSRGYMDAPRGGQYDFVRDVLEPKPDLVTIEFVNDAYLNEEQVQTHYAEIMGHLNGIGAEVILITPHLVRPDWMRMNTLKFDEDPRPYVKGLRRFAQENDIALADASIQWCRLWRQGIPYVTLEGNSINHPDARGHEIFARALIDLFPEP
jgi:lysophospholipase L1-like esterase